MGSRLSKIHTMSYFTKINKLLDEGWTMSNINCEECKGSIMYNASLKAAKCAKCDKPMDVVVQSEETDNDPVDDELIPEYPQPNATQEDGSKNRRIPIVR